MEPGSYPSPVGESASHSARRAAQLISISVAAAQGYVIVRSRQAAIRAAEEEQAQRALRDQERRDYQQARLGWAPALDPAWLAQADLVQAARTWGAAAPYAQTDASAADAIRVAEGRLRALHPYAMTRYDRLRADGLNPADAMTETAPFFARHPFAREGQPGAPRAALTAIGPRDTGSSPGHAGHDDQLAAGAGRTGAGDLSHPAASPLPGTANEVARGLTDAGVDASAARAAALAAQCFPVTASQALRATAAAGQGPSPARGRKLVPRQAVRPGRREVASG